MDKKIAKLNLFLIGASKCGTTSLWHMLSKHPDVFMCEPKEPWFFSFSNYVENLEWYRSLFSNVTNEKIVGEASPVYSETTLIPDIPSRLYKYNPEAKIIYIVREPISRLISVWRQTLSTGHWHKQVYKNYTDVEVPLMSKNFKEAIFDYPPYVEATRYYTHLNNYRKYFDDPQILLLFFEDLKKDPKLVYDNICSFLGIEKVYFPEQFEVKNSSLDKTMTKSWVVRLEKVGIVVKLYQKMKTFLNLSFITSKRIGQEFKISNSLKRKIVSELDDEVREILKYGNKPPNFWRSN